MRNRPLFKRGCAIGVIAICVVVFQNCSGVNFVTMEDNLPSCREMDAFELTPKLKFAWDPAPTEFPQFDQVMSSPAVGDIDRNRRPEIVFVTFTRDSASHFTDLPADTALYNANGVLRVIDGETGWTKFSVGSKEVAPLGDVMPLLVDIDGDGLSEIVYLHYSGEKVVALNSDGALRWTLPVPTMQCRGGLAAADLDGDGRAEIIGENIVIQEDFNRRPKIRFAFPDSTGGRCTSFAATLDPAKPNVLSIVTANAVHKNDGSLAFPLSASGFNAVADMRPDIPGLEIIQSGNGRLIMYNGLTGQAIFKKNLFEHSELICNRNGTSVIGGGPPTIGDFRGDGSVQIAVATGRSLTLFDNLGNKIAGSVTKDCSSQVTGITSYDFNGDGKPEIVYGDENYLRIYNMSASLELEPVHEILNPSGTLLEYPVVADVDGNQSAELVVVSNNYGVHTIYEDPKIGEAAESITGLRVFEPSGEGAWMPTRSLWNQYAYFVNNVKDDLRATASTLSTNPILNRLFRRNTQGENKSLSCREPI